jgi:hypothetical protein
VICASSQQKVYQHSQQYGIAAAIVGVEAKAFEAEAEAVEGISD